MVHVEMNALRGKVLAITRSEKEGIEFSRLVAAEGGTSIALQTIDVESKGPDAARELLYGLLLKKHDYCAFMSAQAVEVLSGMGEIAEVRRALHHTSVIAVGPKTREKLEEVKIRVDFVPADFSSDGIVRMLSGMFPSGKKIIIPRSAEANNQAARGLRSIGMIVDEVMLYSVRAAKPTEQWIGFARLLVDGKVDAIVFTSASSVKAFFEILDKLITKKIDLGQTTQVVSIGPCTTLELKKRKIKCSEAQVHTVRGTFDLALRILMDRKLE